MLGISSYVCEFGAQLKQIDLIYPPLEIIIFFLHHSHSSTEDVCYFYFLCLSSLLNSSYHFQPSSFLVGVVFKHFASNTIMCLAPWGWQTEPWGRMVFINYLASNNEIKCTSHTHTHTHTLEYVKLWRNNKCGKQSRSHSKGIVQGVILQVPR